MHSQRAFVVMAYWYGLVALSTAGPNCWDIVLANNFRTTSSATMPRTLPSGFVNAVNLPNRTKSTTPSGT